MNVDLAPSSSDYQPPELRHLIRGDDSTNVADPHSHKVLLKSRSIEANSCNLVVQVFFLIFSSHSSNLLKNFDFVNHFFEVLNSRI